MCRLRTSCGPRAGLVRTPWFPAVVPRTCSTDHHYFQRKLGGETSVLRTFIFACSFSKLPPPACPGTACNQFCPWMGHQQDSNTWLRLLDRNVRSHWLWQLDTSQQSFQTVHFRYLHECCVYMVIHSKNMFKLMFKTWFSLWCNLRLHGVYMFPECVQNRFCPEIIGVPLGRQVGVTFWPCWCAEFHAGEHPRTKVGATTAGACTGYTTALKKNIQKLYRSSRKLLRTWNVLTFQEAFHIISPPFCCGFPFGKFHYHMFHFRSQSKGTGESNLDTLALSELLAAIF